ncbi:hypothetical protein CSC76_07505 [Pseudoxanthomonas mexicana]|jgi:hypothetical protein|uniref:DUF3883 domain-containing protein n=1 Tax=Pseudoxanthomonas mexicana TaxID=128785 RepID=UPI0013896F76|nr:DUF3883 domain-containing protein [Pseudoxanthomonas mexicana]KAF1728055.1 hypothetical protein CSC76_07505 [Pseudoxanthomonas mexicana]
MSVDKACKLLEATYDGAGLDLEGAMQLHELIEPTLIDRQVLYRQVIGLTARTAAPTWLPLLCSGREAIRAVDTDVATCFERAGAFDPIPDQCVIDWWDELASLGYADDDLAKMSSGREAERLSLRHEQERLANVPDAPEVVWKSLDSNVAGYDIQSWQLLGGSWSPRYIEVKGSKRSPPILFLTRNEWNTAVRHGEAYAFHVWDLHHLRLAEVSVEHMATHVPTDSGNGKWEQVRVQLDEVAFT